MTDDLDEVLALKASAKSAREDGDWQGAIDDLQDAIELLQRLVSDAPTRRSEQLHSELADCYGMIGGIQRRWALLLDEPERRRRLEASVDAYDEGYRYEKDLTTNASTYNRINRLTGRVLLDPEVLRDHTGAVDVPAELGVAESVLLEQLGSQRMRDPWGYADLAMIRLLRGTTDSTSAYRELDRMKPPSFVYESALAALEPLELAAGPLVPEIALAVQYLRRSARSAVD
ncbi:MAG: tetratricopeptide repeat-containing protein [Acidimicrobiia bacterium]